MTPVNEATLRKALEAAGVEFIDENGGGLVCASETGRAATLEVGSLDDAHRDRRERSAVGWTRVRVDFIDDDGWGQAYANWGRVGS